MSLDVITRIYTLTNTVNNIFIFYVGTWETCKESVNSEDNAGTSLISNMDSDSLNEVSNESLLDDLNPLFLKLDCNIFSENNTAKCSINVIPTCICKYY